MENATDRDHLWANNFQSLCQLLRGGFPGFINGSLAEASALRKLCQCVHTVVVGDTTLTVRLTVVSKWKPCNPPIPLSLLVPSDVSSTGLEGAAADAHLLVIGPDVNVSKMPGAQASSYKVCRWAIEQPKGVRWIPIDVKFSGIGAGCSVKENEVEFYRWGKESRGAKRETFRSRFEIVLVVVEGLTDAIAIMPAQIWAATTDQSIGIEPTTARAPHFLTPFIVEQDDFELMLSRLVQSASPSGPWYVNPTTNVQMEFWRPIALASPRMEPANVSVPSRTSMDDMFRLFDDVELSGTAYSIQFSPVPPAIRDFDLQREGEGAVRCEFKVGPDPNDHAPKFLEAGRQWDMLICRVSDDRLFCLARNDAAPYMGQQSLSHELVEAHMFEDAAEMMMYIERNASRARVERQKALRDVKPDDVCGPEVWVLNPGDNDPKSGRKNKQLLLPWVPSELVASCAAARYGVPLGLGRGDPSGMYTVVHHEWSNGDVETYQSTGRLPFDIWNVDKKKPGAYGVVLRLLDLGTPNNRNPMCEPFSMYRRDWRRPTPGQGRYFFLLGSVLSEKIHRAGTARGSRYLFLPSEFTALSSTDTLKQPDMQKKTTGEHYARRQKVAERELQEPRWGGQAGTVNFNNKNVHILSSDGDGDAIEPTRYVIGLLDGSIVAAIKDVLSTTEGETSIDNPLFSDQNRSFARVSYHRLVRDLLQAKWDNGCEFKCTLHSLSPHLLTFKLHR
jgi:hypothetical protein